MNQKHNRVELTVMYGVIALLLVSLGGLFSQVTAAVEEEQYPNLYNTTTALPQPPDEKTIYLTFDDGPSENTSKILDILQKHQAKATFFVTAQNADADYMPEVLQRIVDEGHTIGLHSYTHRADQIYQSVESYLQDIHQLNDYLIETVGIHPEILRFPGGSATVHASPETMKAIIREMTRRGYPYYDWDVVSGDDTTTVYDAAYLAERIVRGAEGLDSAIVLLHDSPAPVTTPQAVDIAIQTLSQQGYQFCALDTGVPPVHIKTSRFSLD